MILYHATHADLPLGESLRTPTGKSEMDVTTGGVVYLTDTVAACERYGNVYEVEVKDAVPYAQQLKAQGRHKKGPLHEGRVGSAPRKHKDIKESEESEMNRGQWARAIASSVFELEEPIAMVITYNYITRLFNYQLGDHLALIKTIIVDTNCHPDNFGWPWHGKVTWQELATALEYDEFYDEYWRATVRKIEEAA